MGCVSVFGADFEGAAGCRGKAEIGVQGDGRVVQCAAGLREGDLEPQGHQQQCLAQSAHRPRPVPRSTASESAERESFVLIFVIYIQVYHLVFVSWM